jgi:hypothetical protein
MPEFFNALGHSVVLPGGVVVDAYSKVTTSDDVAQLVEAGTLRPVTTTPPPAPKSKGKEATG